MAVVSDPNLIVGGLGLGLLALAVLWRFIVWIRDAPRTPDPWDAAVEEELKNPEVPQICHRCLTPQEPDAWFCRHCGAAVGPYNNLMPFVDVFSEGEVLRNGISHRFRNRPFIASGYILVTLGFFLRFALNFPLPTVVIFSFFGLVYLVSVLRNLKQRPDQQKSDDIHGLQSQ